MPLAAVKRFRGISSGGKPPFVIPRRLTEPRSRRKYGLNGYFRQLFLTSASKSLSECSRIGGSERMRIIVRINGNFQHGIFHRYHRKYVATTDSNHNPARLPNLIDRQFNRYAICGDITYIPTDEGRLFMASVLDLASRCLVGYSFDSTMKTSLVVDALRMAIANEHPSPGLIFHSDQGSQYCSHVFQEFLLHQGISGSMSERGQCWDNAPAESFWATLKRETLPLSGCFSSRKEAQDTVTRWISYYNGTRPHSQLGMRSPYQFRLRAQAL